jgi:hypothetical protein
MERNPYAPPQAAVADPRVEYDIVGRPREVAVAVKLLWVAFGLGLLASLLDWRNALAKTSWLYFIVGQIFGVVIGVWFIHKISIGRNWMRILFLIFMTIAVLSLIAGLFWLPLRAVYAAAFTRSMLTGTLRMIPYLLQLAALICVYTRPAQSWFTQQSARR